MFVVSRFSVTTARFGVNSLSGRSSTGVSPSKTLPKPFLVSSSWDTVDEKDSSRIFKVEGPNSMTGASETSRSLKYAEMRPETVPKSMVSRNIPHKIHFRFL